MKRSFKGCAGVLALAWFLLPGARGFAQQQADGLEKLHVNVRLINVFVNVQDKRGAPLGGLDKESFSVFEDGHPERIAVFEKRSEMPISVVLAMDTSSSVHKDLRIEQEAARQFVHSLIRPHDRLDLMTFNMNVREVVPFTDRIRAIDAGIDGLSGGGATALYDAVYLASQRLQGQPGRKVIVLVSDGGNTMKGVSYATALDEATRAEALVYSIIIVPIAASAGRDTGGEHALIQLSNDSGGRYYYVDDPGKLADTFQQVSDDLRAQYMLGYYPSNSSSKPDFRRIAIRLTDPALAAQYSVRHRTGYFASGTAVPEY